MRIYSNGYELISETGRNLWEMGSEVKPKTYQNKVIAGNDDFITKELICEQYCLTKLEDEDILFVFTNCKDWAIAEFKERIDSRRINPGEAYKLRWEIWNDFLTNIDTHEIGSDVYSVPKFDYTYSERINTEVDYKGLKYPKLEAIIRLLEEDQDTRKAVLNIFGTIDSNYYDGYHRIPCSMYYDFLIRENPRGEKQLNLCYHQRSSDFITHFGNDVWLAWQLKDYVANRLGIKSGYLYHTIDSLHVYKKDWVKLKTSLNSMV